MLIGITGGIGSGKSTLSRFLRDNGYLVYDTDREARRLQDEDPLIIEETRNLFGDDIYVDGHLDRPRVASQVFVFPDILAELTAIVHPVVHNDILFWAARYPDNQLLFVESAVLFEGGFYKLMEKIILVTADEEIRIQRVMKRDNVNREQVLARIKNQIPDSLKAQRSDLVIYTDQGLPDNVLESIQVWQH